MEFVNKNVSGFRAGSTSFNTMQTYSLSTTIPAESCACWKRNSLALKCLTLTLLHWFFWNGKHWKLMQHWKLWWCLLVQAWLEEMAAYVKSVDENHMLTTGLEGFYSSTVSSDSVVQESSNPGSYATQYGVDFIRNHQVSGIDFASVHLYPDNWYCPPPVIQSYWTMRKDLSYHSTPTLIK